VKKILLEWAPVISALASLTTATIALATVVVGLRISSRMSSMIRKPLDLNDEKYLRWRFDLCRQIAEGSWLERLTASVQLSVDDWRRGMK